MSSGLDPLFIGSSAEPLYTCSICTARLSCSLFLRVFGCTLSPPPALGRVLNLLCWRFPFPLPLVFGCSVYHLFYLSFGLAAMVLIPFSPGLRLSASGSINFSTPTSLDPLFIGSSAEHVQRRGFGPST